MIMRNTRKRFAAGVGALALMGSLGIGAAASAAIGPDQPDAPDHGSLTINKYKGAPTTNPSDDDLLDGVEFTVTPIGRLSADKSTCTAIDLTDSAQWDGIDALYPATAGTAAPTPTDPFCLVTDKAVTETTDDGQIKIDPIDIGLYYVEEGTDTGNNDIVSKVPNFVISVPYSNGSAADGWNYNVVVNPKNAVMNAPTKTIADRPDALVVGGEVTWTMTVPIPQLNNDETFNEAIITDALDSRLTYVPNSSVVTIDGTTVASSNYGVTGNAVWTFNADGRTLLNSNMGKDMLITFKTTVDSVGGGAIANDDYSSKFNGTTVPGEPEPYTYWGQLSILKTDNSTPAKNLSGAEFKVFEKGTAECPAAAPATGAVATGTSNSTGVVQWAGATPASPLGLWVANVNNGPATPTPTKDYCLYETKVPAGHTATPITNPVTITPGTEHVNALTVVNAKKDGPSLPLTGAQGTLLMVVRGLVLVAAGTGAVVATRKRQAAQD